MKGFLREFKRINWKLTFFGSKKRTIISMVIGVPVILGVGSFGYQFYLQQNPAVVYQNKINGMTQKIQKTVSLPTDEQPTIATVTDKNVLPKEQFFALAQDGDKIFMYKQHHLAVLYRPTTGQVITKAKLVFADPTPTPQVQVVPAVAGASTSALGTFVVSPTPGPTVVYHPQGKVLVQPQL
jgi:hypothetical protein